MKILKLVVPDVASLRAVFLDESPEGGVFLPGVYALSAGDPLAVWCRFPALSAEILLKGHVLWTRRRPGPPRSGLEPGLGVEFLPGQEEQIGLLHRILEGTARPLPPREAQRTVLITPWKCKLLMPHTRLWNEALIADISLGGARLVSGIVPVHEGVTVEIGLPWYSGTTHPMRLRWMRAQGPELRLGVSRLPKGVIHEIEWSELVDRAAQDFARRVMPSAP